MSDQNNNYNISGASNGFQDGCASSSDSNTGFVNDEISLKQLLVVIGRRKWLILSSMILFGLIAGIISFQSTPIYQSQGSMLIYQPQNSLSGLGAGNETLREIASDIGLGAAVDNGLQVLRSRKLSLNIADSISREPMMADGKRYPIIYKDYPDDSALVARDTVAMRLQKNLMFKKAGSGTDIIKVIYESPSAAASRQVVNIAMSQFNKFSNRQQQNAVDSDTSDLKKGTGQERAQFGMGLIIDSGYTPGMPQKPEVSLYILFGLLAGGVLSIGYVFSDIVFINTVKGTDGLNKLSAPLLTVVPAIQDYISERYDGTDTVSIGGKDISTSLVTFLEPDSPMSESYRLLENNLFHTADNVEVKSLGMSSSTPGEGKTTILANLGVILAEAGHSTIIVEADFRYPNLQLIFGVSNSAGISEVLSGSARLEDVIQTTCAPDLSLLSAGKQPTNVPATMRNESLSNLIKKLQGRFDVVLVDTAPFGYYSDSAQLLKQLDGVAVAVKFRKTNELKLRQTLDKLYRLNINVLGTVLTSYTYPKSIDLYPACNYDETRYETHNG